MWHDGSGGMTSSWSLDKVLLTHQGCGRAWEFAHGTWVTQAASASDCHTEIKAKVAKVSLWEQVLNYPGYMGLVVSWISVIWRILT